MAEVFDAVRGVASIAVPILSFDLVRDRKELTEARPIRIWSTINAQPWRTTESTVQAANPSNIHIGIVIAVRPRHNGCQTLAFVPGEKNCPHAGAPD